MAPTTIPTPTTCRHDPPRRAPGRRPLRRPRRPRRRRRPLDVLVARRPRPTRPARAFVAAGLQPGDRVAIWAPNMRRVDRRRARRATPPAACSCRSTPASRAPRPRTCCAALGRRLLFTVTDFLDTDYVALLDGVDGLDAARAHRRAARATCPPGTASWADFLARRERGRPPRRSRRAIAALDRRRHLRHPLHVGHHRRAQGRDAHPRGEHPRRTASWADVVGLREGDRYLVVNPFFHAFGYKAGHPRLAPARRHDPARTRCSTCPR